MRSTLVTKRSSPTSWIFEPMVFVRSFQPSQSSSARPSSMEKMGYFSTHSAYILTISSALTFRPSVLRL